MQKNMLAAKADVATMSCFYEKRRKEFEYFYPIAQKLNYFQQFKKQADDFMASNNIKRVKLYYLFGFIPLLSIEEK